MEAWTHWVSFCLVGYNPLFIVCLSCLVIMLFFFNGMCVPAYSCVCAWEHVSARWLWSSMQVIFLSHWPPYFLKQSLALYVEQAGLSGLAGLWVASCLCLLSFRITDTVMLLHHCTWFWVMDSGSHVCVWVCACVHAWVCLEHFSHWAISLLPTP